MIYIVEIPHQLPARCWSALSEADAIVRCYQSFIRCGDTPELDASFDDWMAYNGSDLSSQRVYMNAAEAIQGLEEISGHGSGRAVAALRKELIGNGELEEPSDDSEEE